MVLILAPITPHMEIFMRGKAVKDDKRRDAIARMNQQASKWLHLKEQYEETGLQEKFRIKTKGLKPMSYEQALDLKIARVEAHIQDTTKNLSS